MKTPHGALVAVLALFLCAPLSFAAEPRAFRAGAATSNITPQLGEGIVGNFTIPPATHVHDELHARCLVLDDGAEAERVEVRNGVLVHHPIAREEAKAAPLALARAQFVAAVTKRAPSAPAAIDARLADFLGLFEAPPGSFDLVMPSR